MSNELKATKAPWEISWNTFNQGEAHGVYAFGELDLKGHQIAIVNCWPTLDKEANEETGKANLQLIAAAPDLYNALNKIHSECHKLLNRGTNDKLSVIDCLTIIGAIGETCEPSLTKANPDYKTLQIFKP